MSIRRRTNSFIFGGISAAVFLAVGIIMMINGGGFADFAIYAGIAVAAFTFVSCLILANNFIGELVAEIFSWGFISLPGLIFELSLDGILWLITVKLLFWLLGLALAVLCGILAVVLGAALSVFVYPFAIVKSFREVTTV